MAEHTHRLDTNLNDEEQKVYLTIVQIEGEKPLAHIAFDANGISDIINRLAKARANMEQAFPNDHPDEIAALLDPRWFLSPEPMTEGSAIQIRHPGFGWLGFVFSPKEVEHIHRLLSQHLRNLDQPKPKPH